MLSLGRKYEVPTNIYKLLASLNPNASYAIVV